MKKFFTGAERFFGAMDRVAYVGAALSVGGMLFCVTLQVVARMTALTVNWTTELSQYCFLWGTTFASYIAARRGKLIGVELIQNMMPGAVRRVMKFFSWLTCGVFYGIVNYYCLIQLQRLMEQFTPILKWPMGMVYVVMMIGLLLLTVYSFYLAVRALLLTEKQEKREKTAEEIAEEVE
ncbi:MAG: TRAP transporter small permease [Clostridia bacterium]|nr:TRAP transporter small permease [Clostridia bacterium]